jgi:hypothetical protein
MAHKAGERIRHERDHDLMVGHHRRDGDAVLTCGPRGPDGAPSVKGLDAVERLEVGDAEDSGDAGVCGVGRSGSSSRMPPAVTAGGAPSDDLPASFSSSSAPDVSGDCRCFGPATYYGEYPK